LSSRVKSQSSDRLALRKIAPLIHEVRGERVILDSDLAQIYGVSTTRLNEQVKRNADRFPTDFAFRLTRTEMANLMSQIAISSSKHGGRRKLPFVFTEHGAIMAANVLNSKEAVQMSVFVVRAFIKLRETLSTNRELAAKIDELDRKVGTHDKAIGSIIAAIRQLTAPAARKPRAIGFRPKRNGEKDSSVKLRSQHARKK
jgi:hypothetical protein